MKRAQRSYAWIGTVLVGLALLMPFSALAQDTASEQTKSATAATAAPAASSDSYLPEEQGTTSSAPTSTSSAAAAPSASATEPASPVSAEPAAEPAATSSDTEPATSSPEAAPPAPEESYLPSITEVKVMGNQIISTNTIINKIQTQPGKDLAREIINDDIKRLYATGYFQDVRFDIVPDGKNVRIVVVVDEKPVVKEIVIKGNKEYATDKLLKDIDLKAGQILDQHLLKEGTTKIEQRYQKKGYKFVEVDSKVDVNQFTKEAVITIRISEGQKYRVTDITFKGVKAFKHRFLKRKLQTKERFLPFFRLGTFNDEKFQNDIDRILYFYQRDGYLDASVEPEFMYNKEKNTMGIVFTVTEGKQYKTGAVSITGNQLFPESEIWGQLKMLPGEVYSQIREQEDVDALRKFYFERGYINARIIPDSTMNKATGNVDIVYQITEGELYYVDRVKIRGNTKTKDIVIRRELRVRPGEQFNGERLEYSKQRLENLGYFEEVAYETEPGSAANKRDVVFRVKEKQTGEISFGAGISSVDQFIGFAEIAQRNFDLLKFPTFTGGGQSISLGGRWGSVTRDVDLNYLQPYICNKPISLGVNAYHWDREGNNVAFDTRRFGAGTTLGKDFTDHIRGFVGYTLEQVKLRNISSDAHSDVIASGIKNTLSRGKIGFAYDTRDNKFNPKSGWYITASTEMVGGMLFGDQDYYSGQVGVTRFIKIKEEQCLELRNRFGVMDEFGDSNQVPVFDRFFAGGLGTVRGYNYRHVGPMGNGQAIGGKTLALSSAEYVFPIIENFKGAVFVDAGHVNYDYFKITVDEIAVSVGPGLRIATPLGPMAFYYGYPIVNKDDKDRNGRFEFSLSKGF